jgi:RNA polymerase subunit RPABC4/transcription elongation factor Spt4
VDVKIEQISGKWFFETKEEVLHCKKCKKSWVRKKICPKCQTENTPFTKQQIGIIAEDKEKYSCSCIFSSWHRFGGHWKNNYPKSKCKHYLRALKEIEKGDD